MKRTAIQGLRFFLVRGKGLEPSRQRHTHLKRACLPVPASSHTAVVIIALLIMICQQFFAKRCRKLKRVFFKKSELWVLAFFVRVVIVLKYDILLKNTKIVKKEMDKFRECDMMELIKSKGV